VALKTPAELLQLAKLALEGQGFTSDLAAEVAEEFVIAELSGAPSHGIGKLVSLEFGTIDARPIIECRGAVISVDGRGGNGFVLLREVVDRVIQTCRQTGISAAFVRNFSRYSSLYPYSVRLARQGLIGLIANTAGPCAVAPFGSIDPITGTNPICFSFPTDDAPQTFDLASAEVVWGAIRHAALTGQQLPAGPFLDMAGHVTTQPTDVNAVRAFGGAKGFALNLAIEILAGPLAGAKAGLAVASEFDCGALVLAIDPAATGALTTGFCEKLHDLFASIRASRPEDPSRPVRVPGDSGRSHLRIADLPKDAVEISEAVVELLQRMASREKVSDLAKQRLFN
jgi:L-2-hydroxycarboxylate dehydrogenase (NAD+)